jgi:hypothetical protein
MLKEHLNQAHDAASRRFAYDSNGGAEKCLTFYLRFCKIPSAGLVYKVPHSHV